ncbi:UNVERIFIED_CONTAM: hypothetical protein HDU68_012301 [Siphonaria sp. JEL0065]|nr:hypothetical protein HDU68_012301 [Siphonaria sp. JEL0065]
MSRRAPQPRRPSNPSHSESSHTNTVRPLSIHPGHPSSQPGVSASDTSSPSDATISPLFIHPNHPSRLVLPPPVASTYPIPLHPLSLQPDSIGDLTQSVQPTPAPLPNTDDLVAAGLLAELSSDRTTGESTTGLAETGRQGYVVSPARPQSESPHSDMNMDDLDIPQLERIAVKQYEKVIRNNDKIQEEHAAMLTEFRREEEERVERRRQQEEQRVATAAAAEAGLAETQFEDGEIEGAAATATSEGEDN